MVEHPIVHVDIPTQDTRRVSSFYSKLFGWKIQPLPNMNYVRFQSPNGLTGGFVDLGGELQHRIGELLVYVGSEDIEADLKRVAELGGKILVPKTEIPNTGWFAIFQDPTGNRIGLFNRTGFVTAPAATTRPDTE
jgi:predicted enzyme related to lactoylglutathione lyase